MSRPLFFQRMVSNYPILSGGRWQGPAACVPSAKVMWGGYEIIILISLPNPPPVRVAASGTTASRFNQPNLILAPSAFQPSLSLPLFTDCPLTLTSIHLFPRLIHPFPPPPPPSQPSILCCLPFKKEEREKNVLDYTSREHPLAASIFFRLFWDWPGRCYFRLRRC